MIESFTSFPAALLLIGPTLLLLLAVTPGGIAERHPRTLGQLIQVVGLVSLTSSLVAALMTGFAEQTGPSTLVVFGSHIGHFPLALSARADSLSFTLMTLISLLAAIIARYSTSYLAGEATQGSFFRWLAFTVSAFMLVVIAGNMLMFVLAIGLTGSGLNRLLTHYRDRLPAQMVAHKKLLFSRMADASLLVAAVLIAVSEGTSSFEALAETAAQGDLDWQLHLAAWLIVAYAVLKSGQFPFHGWLLQVMEAPTPVSALLHAGIVYSGAIIVMRTHELLLADGYALVALALVGLMTAAIASLAMLTQTAIKSSLAWSTAGQLGFMLLELGLGLFVLAVLHLIAHSLYKAHAFLSSGSMVDILRVPGTKAKKPVTLLVWAAAVMVSAVITFAMAALWGITPATEPSLVAIGTIVTVAVSQLLLAGWSGAALTVRLVVASLVVTGVYFGLHTVFSLVFSGTLNPIPHEVSAGHYLLLVLIAAVFLGLSFFQSVLTSQPAAPWLQRVYVHLHNGLYTDLPVERLVYRVWPARFRDLPGRRGRLRS